MHVMDPNAENRLFSDIGEIKSMQKKTYDWTRDQESRIRGLESFRSQAKGVIGVLVAMKVWVVKSIFGGGG